ncbi:MAG TPA: hypothetical protein PK821_07555, partial [Victivallales bacterium]|nr:hypothetical protein [Victivallales bacterium]
MSEINIKTLKLDQICPSKLDRVVAVEICDGNEAEIFSREKDCSLKREKIPFSPFIMLERDSILPSKDGVSQIVELLWSGNGKELCSVAKFASVETYEKALSSIKKSSGFAPTSPNAPYKIFSDLVQQSLILGQIRLFRGMTFREIRRLQFDIETLLTDGYDFPNPERPDDK